MKIQLNSSKVFNIIASASILSGLFFSFVHPSFALTNTVGFLEYTYDTDPIFNSANLAPGDSVSKNLTVRNLSSSDQVIGIQGTKSADDSNLAPQITFTVSRDGSQLYSKSLADFFADGEVNLSTIGGGQPATFVLQAVFNSGAGNEFMGKKVMFDLTVGSLGSVSGTSTTSTASTTQGTNTTGKVLGQSTGEVLGISTFPETGASFWVIVSLFACLLGGLVIRRLAKRQSSKTHDSRT